MVRKIYRVRVNLCPSCGGTLNAVGTINVDAEPEPGDVTWCRHCLLPLQFTKDMSLQVATEAVLQEVEREQPEDYKAFMGMKEVLKSWPKPKNDYKRN